MKKLNELVNEYPDVFERFETRSDYQIYNAICDIRSRKGGSLEVRPSKKIIESLGDNVSTNSCSVIELEGEPIVIYSTTDYIEWNDDDKFYEQESTSAIGWDFYHEVKKEIENDYIPVLSDYKDYVNA